MATLKGYGRNGAQIVLRTVREQPQNPANRDPVDRPKGRYGQLRSDVFETHKIEKSAWRARSQLRDWLLMTCVEGTDWRLVTLTKRGGIATLDDVWPLVEKFRKAVARHYPGLVMSAVPELHHGQGVNASTYHVHCVLVFPAHVRPIYSVFHRIWKRCLGGTGAERGDQSPGNVDFAPTHARNGRRYSPAQAARYLGKYITKDFYVGRIGQKRYTVSHGAPEPSRRYWWQPFAYHEVWTRKRMVEVLREHFPQDDYRILMRSFKEGGDDYLIFSAEPT
jgi:hypothetical protein